MTGQSDQEEERKKEGGGRKTIGRRKRERRTRRIERERTGKTRRSLLRITQSSQTRDGSRCADAMAPSANLVVFKTELLQKNKTIVKIII